MLIDFDLPGDLAPAPLKIGSQASVIVFTGDHLLVNMLARLQIRLLSILTYAY